MVSLEIFEKPDSQWNQRLQSSLYGTVYQTKEYAEYLQLRLKLKPVFLKFKKNDSVVGQLLAFQSFKGKAKIEKSFGKGILSNTLSKISLLPKNTRWSYGPLVFEEIHEKEIGKSLGEWLKNIKGNFQGSPHPLNTSFDFPIQFNFKKKKSATFVIDLREDLETIFKKTNKNSVQKNILRAQNRGVKITPIQSKSDLMIYYDLQKIYRKENNLIPYQKADILEIFRLLSPLGYEGLIAWLDEIPIGAISFSTFNGYINESGIARSNLDADKKLYSQDLLRWKIIEWGKTHNCIFYDLSGVKSENRDQKENGIFRNKEKWGGKLVEYYSFYG